MQGRWTYTVWLLLALTLTGCGAVTERLLGWYVTRTLDGYLDFTSAQKQAARVVVDDTLISLRKSEVQAWVSFLREVRQGIHDGLTEDGIARLQRHYDTRLDEGVAFLAPRFAALLVDLSAAQLDHFAMRMREDVDKQYEERSLPPDKRQAAIEKRAFKVLEDFVGHLSDAQIVALRALLRGLPDERPAQYRSAYDNIARFRTFMAKEPNAAEIAAELHALWEHRYDGLGKGREKAVRRVEQRKALYSVLQLLDREQRAHAEEELSERIRMLKRFALAGGSTARASPATRL